MAGAILVVSDSGDILSPKYAPERTAPATRGKGNPSPAPIPIKAMPMVPEVPHEVPVAREVMDVNLTGLGGGTIMGKHFIEPRLTNAVDDLALTSHFFYKYNQKYTWPSISESEEHLLFSEPLKSQIQGLAYESFCEELEPYLHYRSDVKSEYFHLRNHEWRFMSF